MDSEELASESILGQVGQDEEDHEMADESGVPEDQATATSEVVDVSSLHPEEKSAEAEPGVVKLSQIPLARIKHIMKLDTDLHMASQEAVFMVTKALELFIESLAIESFSYTSSSKKKTMSKDDVFKAIDSVDALAFLDGAMD